MVFKILVLANVGHRRRASSEGNREKERVDDDVSDVAHERPIHTSAEIDIYWARKEGDSGERERARATVVERKRGTARQGLCNLYLGD